MLERVVRLIAYISDKDLFGEFYRKKLARRLLQDRSTSEEHERLVLTTLKEQCGAQFTQKMEGMVKDLQLARDKGECAAEGGRGVAGGRTRARLARFVAAVRLRLWEQAERLPTSVVFANTHSCFGMVFASTHSCFGMVW